MRLQIGKSGLRLWLLHPHETISLAQSRGISFKINKILAFVIVSMTWLFLFKNKN